MARLPYFDKKDLAPEHQDLLDRPINLNRVLVNSPHLRRASGYLAKYQRYESKLNPRLRELAILEVGYLTRSPYEWSHHVKLGRDFGVKDEDLRALIDWTEGRPTKLDALTEAVLRGAREVTEQFKMSDQTFNFLRDQLGNEQLTDLVFVIAYYSCIVRILATLEIDVEPDYAKELERFPLPKS